MELSGTRQVFHVAVASRLVEFVRTQTRSCGRRVGLNSVTLIEIALLVQLFEQVPQGLYVLVVVRDIRMFQVHPITHLTGQFGPLGGVLHHFLAASGIVLVHTNLLADILFRDTQHFLHT